MPRATRVLTAPERAQGTPADTLMLSSAQRRTQKGFLFGLKGTCVECDFPEPVALRTDDVLVLDDGRLVEIVAEPEPVIELRVADASAMARLAWHMGDRHIPVQVLERRLRVKREPATEALLEAMAVKMTILEAPFEPESGPGFDGDHHHDHHHHEHHHHDHAHDHGHSHGHDHDHAHDHKHR